MPKQIILTLIFAILAIVSISATLVRPGLDLAITACSPDTALTQNVSFHPVCTITNVGDVNVQVYTGMKVYRNNVILENWPTVDSRFLSPGQSVQINFPTVYLEFSNSLYRIDYTITPYTGTDTDLSNNSMSTRITTWGQAKQYRLLELASGVQGAIYNDNYGAVLALNQFAQEGFAVLNHQYYLPYFNDYSEARIAFYGITEFPTAVFEGTRYSTAASETENIYPAYAAEFLSGPQPLSPVEIEIYGSRTLNIYDFYLRINRFAWLDGTDWNLYLAIAENNLPVNWMGLQELDFVTRYLVSPNQQINFDSSNPPYLNLQQYLQIEPFVDIEDCMVIVWLQDNQSRNVIQTNMIPLSELQLPPVTNQDDQHSPTAIHVSAFPNPFRTDISFNFDHKAAHPVQLSIYNLRGQQLYCHSYHLNSGAQHLVWDGRDQQAHELPAGIYLYRLQSGTGCVTGKLLKTR